MPQRILVVDDEPANVELLTAFLGDIGADILGVTDAKEAEHAFAGRLRSARDSLGFLPVIVLTADERTVARNSALIHGANDFLTKPLDRVEVLLRVRNQLRTRNLFNEVTRATGSYPVVER